MSEKGSQGEDIFDLDRIRRLVDLMKEHDLGEIDLQQAEQRIRLSRASQHAVVSLPASPAPVQQAPVASPVPSAAAEDGAHIVLVKSPMVGTYYSRPNPNSKNFVEIGSTVQADTTICIIEAMKVFNEIPSEVRGKVVSILVQNEESVDFGKPLFKIDTRG